MKQKKVVTASILISSVILSLTSCAEQPQSVSNTAEVESLMTQIESLEAENDELKAQLEAISDTAPEETTQAQKGLAINEGDTITTDTMEITINKVELTYDVLPDDTSGFYTHYEADAGNVYLHIDADVKNIAKQNLPCDSIAKLTADYNNGYTYSGNAVPEDSTTGFTYANITTIKPLATLGVHFIFKCPQEVAENTNPLFVTIEPANSSDSYILTIR